MLYRERVDWVTAIANQKGAVVQWAEPWIGHARKGQHKMKKWEKKQPNKDSMEKKKTPGPFSHEKFHNPRVAYPHREVFHIPSLSE